jgi:predicted transposase YdaD
MEKIPNPHDRPFKDILSRKDAARDFLETVIRYVFHTVEGITAEGLKEIVEGALSKKEGDVVMTLAEEIRNEGFQEGIQQGMQQGMLEEGREGILDILEARFDVVSESIARDVRGIEELGVLKSLRRKSVSVATLDEFKELLKKAKG